MEVLQVVFLVSLSSHRVAMEKHICGKRGVSAIKHYIDLTLNFTFLKPPKVYSRAAIMYAPHVATSVCKTLAPHCIYTNTNIFHEINKKYPAPKTPATNILWNPPSTQFYS